jgi:aromatic ring-cleaving dioxygenase
MSEKAPEIITSYHAHVYFNADTTETARELRGEIEARFEGVMQMGRFHEKPVGPHPQWSYQVLFEPDQFPTIIQWLSLNRRGLDVFVHPETGDGLIDHSDHVMWLGNSHVLELGIFNKD